MLKIALQKIFSHKISISCLFLVICIGFMDYYIGLEISTSLFYVLPIGAAALAMDKIRNNLKVDMQRSGWPVTFSIGMIT